MNRTFCILPWVHSCSRPNGDVLPCCRFQDTNLLNRYKGRPIEALTGPEMDNLRQDMLDGNYVQGCSKCYQEEVHKGTSMRLESNKDYSDIQPQITSKYFHGLRYIEVALSNTCNLQCAMCSSTFSSSWYSLEKALTGRQQYSGILQTGIDLEEVDLSGLRRIKVLGGEPLLDQKFFELVDLLVSTGYSKNIRLMFFTNSTVYFNTNLKENLKRFQSVKISCSIDGYGDLNSYIRRGSSWTKVEEVFLDILELNTEPNIDVCTHSVISAFNVNRIDELLDWFRSKGPHKCSLDILQAYSHPSLQALRRNQKEQIRQIVSSNRNQVARILGTMDSYEPTSSEVQYNLEYIDKYNKLHNMDLEKVNPEIAEILLG